MPLTGYIVVEQGMEWVEVVTSYFNVRDGTETVRTVRFVGELLATHDYGLREKTLYELEAGGFLIYTYDKAPVGPSCRTLLPGSNRETGYTAEEVARQHPAVGTVLGMPASNHEIRGKLKVRRRWMDTEPPQGGAIIAEGEPITSTRQVTLSLHARDYFGSGVVLMRIRNGGGDPWTKWKRYTAETEWKLSEGEGPKVVYV